MTSEKVARKDKNQNIQVFVRLRPLNQRERDIKSLGVVEVVNHREVVVRQSQQTSHTKKFTFDRAFNPNVKQVEVYQEVVSPLIEEVLAGYNCTVFAYGQTGTGKTHTMVGEHSGNDTSWQNDPLAGIIPRALSQLFDELRISNTEYTVRVSYLELYNEELFDLLASSDDNSKLRIYEDITRKGSNIVNGLEEITVYNKNEVYKIMSQGQERKRVASTLMNAQSSRSHTVFTIVVHMKENSPEGEELVKVGKLNLVDLAGSENISKAGSDCPAKRERARECVNINQSLLTLGRVITALVERHPHIPYRESKLTRILQESLGGKTKTSIIATISPGHKDLEETMSTLEYAHRAKNIQNKPEINQKMTKKAILKEYVEEIDRLKRDLQAARDKNGVYLANETFTEMMLKQEEQRKEIQGLLLKGRAMEDERDRMTSVFEELNAKLNTTDKKLNKTAKTLAVTTNRLAQTDNALRATKQQYDEQKHLVMVHSETESTLVQKSRTILSVADAASEHNYALHDNIDKRKNIESKNLELTQTFGSESSQLRERLMSGVHRSTETVLQDLNTMHSYLDIYTTSTTEAQEKSKTDVEELIRTLLEAINETKTQTDTTKEDITTTIAKKQTNLQELLQAQVTARRLVADNLLQAFLNCVQQTEGVVARGDVASFVKQWYCGALARVESLRRSHGGFVSHEQRQAQERREKAVSRRALRRARHDGLQRHAEAVAEIEKEKGLMESRLNQQVVDISREREECAARLGLWAQREREALEARLAEHIHTETEALEERLTKKLQEIEEERQLLEGRMSRQLEVQQSLLEAHNEELALADEDLELYEKDQNELAMSVLKYGKEFDEGTSAISSDMEVFTDNLDQVVSHIHGQILSALKLQTEQAQKEVNSQSEADVASSAELAAVTDEAFAQIRTHTHQALDLGVTNLETTTSSTVASLTSLASSLSMLSSSALSQLSSQTSTLEAVQHELVTLEASVRETVHDLQKVEGTYLADEYKLYSPTGKTPIRSTYRYPRDLKVTSPHERILARYRANRAQAQDEDCMVIDNEEPRADSDASSSDDSVFAAPSPLASLNEPPSNLPIMKSTSETDIYVRRKQQEQQGKENADRSVSYKRPSKLPAPSSLKKPLVERN